MKVIDMTGRTCGQLKVLGRAPAPEYCCESYQTRAWWRCECKCGAVVDVDGSSLRSKRVKSCGCLRKELVASRTKEAFAALKERKEHNGS